MTVVALLHLFTKASFWYPCHSSHMKRCLTGYVSVAPALLSSTMSCTILCSPPYSVVHDLTFREAWAGLNTSFAFAKALQLVRVNTQEWEIGNRSRLGIRTSLIIKVGRTNTGESIEKVPGLV